MPAERESDQPEVNYDPWPAEWSGGGSVRDEQALRDLRDGLIRGRIARGSRWEVPIRAALAVAVLAFVVVVVLAVLVLRSLGSDEGVAIGENDALVSTSAAEVAPSDATAVSPSPAVVPSAVGESAVAQAQVHVVGQVRSPGVVSLGPDARVQDAIEAAGGATGKADLARINLARKVVDGERILVPRPGQEIPDEVTPSSAAAPEGAGAAPGAPVNLNTASVTELDALPGVGPVLAGRIVEWRQANGRFATVDDLNEVSGIGDATMEKLRPLVSVS